MDYLITGGAGFIGSHLADALLARGDSVTLLDNLSTGSSRNVWHLVDDPRVTFIEGSIMDENLLPSLVARSDVVVHLAASVGMHLIIERPLESLLNNIRGTEIVLEACADTGRKILVASTSEIYGKNTGALHEDADRVLGSPFVARWSYSRPRPSTRSWRSTTGERAARPRSWSGCSTAWGVAKPVSSGWWFPASCARRSRARTSPSSATTSSSAASATSWTP